MHYAGTEDARPSYSSLAVVTSYAGKVAHIVGSAGMLKWCNVGGG
jgi:hypothetical protein